MQNDTATPGPQAPVHPLATAFTATAPPPKLRRTPGDTPVHPLATAFTVLTGAIAVLLRFIPHPANFSSIGTMGLFGGARLIGWRAYLLPLGLMVLSDCGLWALTGDMMFSPFHLSRTYVYGSFMLYVVIGRWLQNTDSVWRVSAASLLGSLQFYLLTNFGNWLLQPLDTSMPDVFRYSRDLSGLVTCMAAGLPFYQGDNPVDVFGVILGHDFRFGFVGLVLGDLVFANAIFVLHGALARKLSPTLAPDVRPIKA